MWWVGVVDTGKQRGARTRGRESDGSSDRQIPRPPAPSLSLLSPSHTHTHSQHAVAAQQLAVRAHGRPPRHRAQAPARRVGRVHRDRGRRRRGRGRQVLQPLHPLVPRSGQAFPRGPGARHRARQRGARVWRARAQRLPPGAHVGGGPGASHGQGSFGGGGIVGSSGGEALGARAGQQFAVGRQVGGERGRGRQGRHCGVCVCEGGSIGPERELTGPTRSAEQTTERQEVCAVCSDTLPTNRDGSPIASLSRPPSAPTTHAPPPWRCAPAPTASWPPPPPRATPPPRPPRSRRSHALCWRPTWTGRW